MSGKTNVISQSPPADRRAVRRSAAQSEIVDAAWTLVREQGLAALSMRDLGERVGMRAQSLYSYFASKDEIYDAMFRQACEQQLASMSDAGAVDDAPAHLRAMAYRFFDFCTSDPVRYQLLFQRTIPGFVPSPESYAVAVQVLERTQADLARAGLADQASIDLAIALMTGLASQQLANEPGGQRWALLIDRAVDLILAPSTPHPNPTTPTPRRRR
jgi:AcrR family transcriptional regulator